MKFKLVLLTFVFLLCASSVWAQSFCSSIIIDKAGVIQNQGIVLNAARPLIDQGVDVKVITVDWVRMYGADLTAVERYFEQTCPSWVNQQTGQRKANLFVVMVAPNDRTKNIFLGSYYNGAFDIPSTYSQLANSYFKNRQWEQGIASVLNGTASRVLSFRQSMIYPHPPAGAPLQASEDSHTGLWVLLSIFGVLTIIVVGYSLILIERPTTRQATTYGTEDPDYVPTSSASYVPTSSASYVPSRYPTTRTTVINNNSGSGDGFVTGLVVGEMLNRPTVYVEPPGAQYVEPRPSYDQPVQTPDSTWEEPRQQDPPDTNFSSDPAPDSPSDSSSSDSGF